jgi:sortase (surface protein transpeptidase)
MIVLAVTMTSAEDSSGSMREGRERVIAAATAFAEASNSQNRVTRYTVVEPDELWVLDASPAAALTLITCSPFDFVGAAPRRFVVHAERIANPGESSLISAAGEDGTR